MPIWRLISSFWRIPRWRMRSCTLVLVLLFTPEAAWVLRLVPMLGLPCHACLTTSSVKAPRWPKKRLRKFLLRQLNLALMWASQEEVLLSSPQQLRQQRLRQEAFGAGWATLQLWQHTAPQVQLQWQAQWPCLWLLWRLEPMLFGSCNREIAIGTMIRTRLPPDSTSAHAWLRVCIDDHRCIWLK